MLELWGWKGQEQGSIGKAQYASAHAALSRCLTRLWVQEFDRILENLNPLSNGNYLDGGWGGAGAHHYGGTENG